MTDARNGLSYRVERDPDGALRVFRIRHYGTIPTERLVYRGHLFGGRLNDLHSHGVTAHEHPHGDAHVHGFHQWGENKDDFSIISLLDSDEGVDDELRKELFDASDNFLTDRVGPVTDEDIAEISRLGQENPLDEDRRLRLFSKISAVFEKHGGDIHESVYAALKAAGTPTHWFVADHFAGDRVVRGPFFTSKEAANVRRRLESTCEDDEQNLWVVEGYNVNGKVVSG